MSANLTNEEVRDYWMDAADELRAERERLLRVAVLAFDATLTPSDATWNELCAVCEDITDAEITLWREALAGDAE